MDDKWIKNGLIESYRVFVKEITNYMSFFCECGIKKIITFYFLKNIITFLFRQ